MVKKIFYSWEKYIVIFYAYIKILYMKFRFREFELKDTQK